MESSWDGDRKLVIVNSENAEMFWPGVKPCHINTLTSKQSAINTLKAKNALKY
jgi:hypothetical protein